MRYNKAAKLKYKKHFRLYFRAEHKNFSLFFYQLTDFKTLLCKNYPNYEKPQNLYSKFRTAMDKNF